jgi:ferredoxin
MMAGANVAMMASELLANGLERIPQILREMEDWMREFEYDSIAQMRGSMSQRNVSEPTAFEFNRGPALRQKRSKRMSKVIDQFRCTRCGECVPVCPNQGIHDINGEFIVEGGVCSRCYGFSSTPQCAHVCPADAIRDSSEPLWEPTMALRAAILRPDHFPRD